MKRRTLGTRGVAVVASLAVGLLLGGCAAPSYDASTAESLQSQVSAVTTASAEGDWDSALMHLQTLEADARDARARGEITADRLEDVLAAVALVRDTLDAEMVAEAEAAADAQRAEAEAEAEAARQKEIEDAAAEERSKAAEEAERRAEEEAQREADAREREKKKQDDDD